MAFKRLIIHSYNRFVVTSLSLTEMLVAVILLSLVTGFAFAAISTMRKNYLVEARIASDRITTTEAMTSLAQAFNENPGFARRPPASFPNTDDVADSRLTIIGLRNGQASYDSSGTARCFLSDIDTSTRSAKIPWACLTAYGLTPDDIITSFQHLALPVIFPEWSPEPCLINQIEQDQQAVRFTVYNEACLSAGVDAGQPNRQVFRLPRLVVLSHERRHQQDMTIGEAAGSDHYLARPKWIKQHISPDGIWMEITSNRPGDRFAIQPVQLFSFGGTAWILPPLMNGLNIAELHIESLTDSTQIMGNCSQQGQQSIRLNRLTPSMLASAFYALCFQRQGYDTAELMFTISSGNAQWRRGIRFRYIPVS